MKTLQRSFGGGEVTPEFWGRVDDAKFQIGLATCRNFIVKPQGPAENRAGLGFVREVKDSTQVTRVINFTYSTTQTMVIEVGAGYFRFHTQGATVLAGSPTAWSNATAYAVGDLASLSGVNYYCVQAHTNQSPPNATYWYALPANGVYEIPNSFAAADLMAVRFVQSADVLTLVHVNYPPQELRRYGATKWILTPIAFNSQLVAPTGVSAVATGGTGTNYSYVVTSVGSVGIDESLQSSAGTCNGNVFATGAYNTISWSAASGATRYYVYKYQGGSYGYIGQTTGTSFTDNNIAADLSRTPPIGTNPFGSAGNYPGTVSYFEQRRLFAGTNNAPQNMWMTKSGTESNLNYSLPTRDDDSIQFRVAAREANTIRHVVPLNSLLMLTSSAEWRVTSINSDALTPSTIGVKPQSYVGANQVAPVIINNNVVFCAARGGHLRDLSYSYQANGYVTGDLSLRASHLFDTYDIVDMAFAKAPYPIVWCVSSSGSLLGFTYIPEQQVGSWHRHDTDGVFESCTVVAEGNEDVLYVVVRRTINGASKRYIERLHTRVFTDPADAFFVDAGLTYSGAAATTISGLSHLEGKTVSILGDGAVMPQQVVTGGAITLPVAVSKAQIGLPITADLQTLPVVYQDPAFGQATTKNVDAVWLRVYRSSGIQAGPSFDKLTLFKQRVNEAYGTPVALKTDEIRIVLRPTYQAGGQVCVRQADPLPLTLLSITPDNTTGD